ALLGRGLRIAGGSARAYYLLVEAEGRERAVCLVPRGAEEGRETRLSGRSFTLRLGQPVRFLVVSTTGDAPHRPGDVVDWDAEAMAPLPPLATVLADEVGTEAGEESVELAAGVTEVGTLEVSCVSTAASGRRWRLEFDLRAGREAAPRSTLGPSHPRAEAASKRIERAYGSRSQAVNPREIRGLRADLEGLLGKREAWSAPLLRELFGFLWAHVRRRRRTADHERAWLNLAGYCLRPGFGYPLDDWRAGELWEIYSEGVQHAAELQVWSEWWTLWRRVAGGLTPAAQEAILDDLSFYLKPPARRGTRPHGPRKQGEEDMVRLAGALERLPGTRKAEVGSWLLESLGRPQAPRGGWWSLGRLGARVPLYGSAHEVVPRDVAAEWVQSALALDWKTVPEAAFAAALMARLSDDRDRDLPAGLRSAVAGRLRSAKTPASWARMVEGVVELEATDQQRIWGDSLPPGLKLAA
ncbi:MAG: molecular chaperone DnaK, partial [Deltaproteobacteria bacterium]|nr:molecular chaperone DnaK [Deltaproteobacteria bacterium]